MRILLVSKFLHHVGGVETYLQWQANALRNAGHEIALVGMEPPRDRELMNLPGRVWLTPGRSFAEGSQGRLVSAAQSIWSPAAGAVMQRALHDFRPDLVHFHGTSYQLTPAVVEPVVRKDLPNVLTAHEYKLICANQTLYDDSTAGICTACLGAGPLRRVANPVRRRCMKRSRAVSALGGFESWLSVPVWHRAKPMILAPSGFMRDMLLAQGWSEERVRYLDLPWRTEAQTPPIRAHEGAHNVVFLGRLAPIKGVGFFLHIWQRVADEFPMTRVRILGDGEQAEALQVMVDDLSLPRVDFLGRQGPEVIQKELSRAAVTVHPSQCHENSPYAVRESLMAGVPALCSAVGGMPAMISTETGWVVSHTDVDGWVGSLREALASPRAGAASLLAAVTARATTEENHLEALHEAYAVRRAGRG